MVQPRATHPLLCCHFTAKALSVVVGEGKLKRIPSGIQTHTPSILKSITSWEELNLQRFAQLDTPKEGASISFAMGN